MKTSVKTALVASLLWMILILVVNLLGYSQVFFPAGILICIFFLLSSIAAGLFLTKREKGFAESIFLDDFKVSLQSGIVFTILVSAFVYLYHEVIDTSIRESLVDARMEAIHKMVPDQATYETEIQAKYPEWKNKTFDDYIENQEDSIEGIISSFSVFVFHLMGLFIFSMFFSFFSTIIVRKVILR